MNQRTSRIILIVLIVLGNVLVDQVSKVIARNELRGKGIVRVVGDVFRMQYTENSGAFLGLGSKLPQPWRGIVFSLFPILLMIGLSVYIFRMKNMTRWEHIWYACIIGGGIGNIIDRIVFNGQVTDFLNFGIGRLRTGILNIADISITAGVAGLIILMALQQRKAKREAAAAAGPAGEERPEDGKEG